MNRNLISKVGYIMSGLCLGIVLFSVVSVSAYPSAAYIMLQVPLSDNSGREMIFSRHYNGKVYVVKQSSTGVGAGTWSSSSVELVNPPNLTIESATLAAALDYYGNPWVFAFVGGVNAPKRIWYSKWNGSSWNAFANLNYNGGLDFIMVCNAIDYRGIQLVTRSVIGSLVQMRIDDNGNVANGLETVFVGENASLVKNANNCLEIFSTAPEGVYYAYQSTPYGSFGFNSVVIGPMAGNNAHRIYPYTGIKCIKRVSGKYEVFAGFEDSETGYPYSIWCSVRNSGVWGEWKFTKAYSDIQGNIKRFDVATRQDGTTELIYKDYIDETIYFKRTYRLPNAADDDWTAPFEPFVFGTNGSIPIKSQFKAYNGVTFNVNPVTGYITTYAPINPLSSTTDIKFGYSYWSPMSNWSTCTYIR